MSGEDLKTLLAKASPARSGDFLAEIAAATRQERVKAQRQLADTTLGAILEAPLIDPEEDDVSALILRQHDADSFRPIAGWSVGEMREWLLSDDATPPAIAALKWALTPEMVAAIAKICRNQDLIAIARKRPVVTAFRTTVGLPGRLSVRIQPNHPTDDPRGVAASIVDGLAFGCGDAVIGINPATDSPSAMRRLLELIEELRLRLGCPVQSCVLAHVTTAIDAMNRAAPVDLVFQSVAGSQKANASFGISLAMLKEAHDAARGLRRGTVGDNVMYFETGQGSALSANAHHGMDQQTMEARAYAVAREFDPLLVNTVVGFIGPEYLYDGKEIIRAGLEDHFCGKLLGVPMGVDVCYTNHAEADQDDMDNLLTLLAVAGVNFVMGVPGSDDVMLNYQSTSFHDAAYVRRVLGLRPSPEFETWLMDAGIFNREGFLNPADGSLMLAARAQLLEAAE
ncbi:ethanolamine ammonia-lyase subunit EutB [Aurantimonas aggregata]|uniref:Ethanolamine ammonia-lyase large subunit n=1 Tax=Aurantimonas aggregata TaxID=2047720 RepID=A0A6L9MED6_9HYPH|nr:ethanolamine ammonia-lyase subunit EutB [Aurantimonas aggregata]NDV86021.1 ethanolamine ammonia-lyase subunit EutB [Aurantimonas aggregata]